MMISACQNDRQKSSDDTELVVATTLGRKYCVETSMQPLLYRYNGLNSCDFP